MDLIKLDITDIRLINKVLDSKYITSKKELENKQIFRIGKKGIKLTKNQNNNGDKILHIELKPHYYFNSDYHNGNMMTAKETIDVLNEIRDKLNLNHTNNNRLTSIEYGLNLIPDLYDTKNIVNQSLYYKKKPLLITFPHLKYFKTTKENDTHPTIYTKLYHKGVQFGGEYDEVHENTLRYENGFTTNRKIKYEFGATNLNDLVNIDMLKKMGEYLLNSWQYVLLIDEIREDINYLNPNYYEDIKHFRNKLNDERKEYYKTNGIWHKEIKGLLEHTYREEYLKMQNPTLIDSLNLHKTNYNEILNPQNTNKCLMTGLDISMQRADSNFLHTSGLTHYLITNTRLYEEIIRKYWSNECRGKQGNELHEIISHNIRNKYFNNLYSMRKKYPKELARFDFGY